MVLTLEFFLNRTIWHYLENIFNTYCEILLHAKLLNLKNFKDFSFMQNQRLLMTFGSRGARQGGLGGRNPP